MNIDTIKQLEDEINHKLEQLEFKALQNGGTGYAVIDDTVVGLSLTGLKLRQLPAALSHLSGIQELHLDDNNLIDCSILSSFMNLKVLDISNNRITKLNFLEKLTQLSELLALENPIESIESLSRLTQLKGLNLSYNEISDLSPIKQLINLETLHLWSCKISDYTAIGTLSKLENLDLAGNNIADVSFLKHLTNLKTLELQENEIQDLNHLSNLKLLEEIDLSSNKIEELSALHSLKNLKILTINDNLITSLEAINELTELVELQISSNKISDLTPLKKLTHLKELIGGRNLISNLFGIENTSLVRLDLWNNNIVDLVPLKNLNELSNLDLSFNQIKNLAPISSLQKLVFLDLANNLIKDISPLNQLNGLLSLSIRKNMLSNIDPLNKLKRLVKLDVSSNNINNLPLWLLQTDMDNYSSKENTRFFNGFNVIGNPIENVPAELLSLSKEAINDYFKSLGAGCQPINEIKVILLGEGAAGKTSLMNYLQGKPYQKGQPQTHGINLEECIQETGVTMKVWDFGGQDIMHHTHQFFLTQKSVYVLVLNARENTDTEKWLKLIQVFGGDSPIIIVTNKIDENPSDHENIKYLNTKYQNLKSRYVRISCENGINLENFKSLLTQTISELLHVRTLWGNNWLQVKHELEAMRNGTSLKDYIHFDKYDEICDKYNVPVSHRETLINWLHRLGVVTYFPDSNLSETNVINPSWLTEAFYSIINSEIVAKQYGRFGIVNLKSILDNKRYPKQKYQFLLGLMIKFELCYKIDDNTYLIPDLLNKEEPNFKFDIRNALKFKYKYSNLLPKAILPKFMVRRHQEIKEDKKWRTGLLIKDNYFESEALIRVDETDKEISIYVTGQEKRGYLASIISNIESINDIYDGLEYEKLIPCCCNICIRNEQPFYHKFEVLNVLRKRNKKTSLCEKSFDDVNINELLGILITSEQLEEEIRGLVGKGTFLTKKYLQEHNIEAFVNTVRSLFSSVSYLLFERTEKAYHTPLLLLLRAIFLNDVRGDEIQSRGRADIIINISQFIYVLELKLDGTTSEAIKQIHANKYYEPYLLEDKKITLIGINFDSTQRNIADYEIEYLN